MDRQPFEFRQNIGFAGLIRNEQFTVVANRIRLDMFIGLRIFHHRRGMDTGFGGKSRSADIGTMPIRRTIEQFIHSTGNSRQFTQFGRRHAGGKVIGKSGFQQQSRDQAHKIGIAAALAQAIQGALNLPRPCLHSCQ